MTIAVVDAANLVRRSRSAYCTYSALRRHRLGTKVEPLVDAASVSAVLALLAEVHPLAHLQNKVVDLRTAVGIGRCLVRYQSIVCASARARSGGINI